MGIWHAQVGATAVFDQRLSDAQFRVWCALRVYARPDGSAWPSLRELATELGKARSTISEHISALERLGYVTKKARYHPDGSHASNDYWVARERPDHPAA